MNEWIVPIGFMDVMPTKFMWHNYKLYRFADLAAFRDGNRRGDILKYMRLKSYGNSKAVNSLVERYNHINRSNMTIPISVYTAVL